MVAGAPRGPRGWQQSQRGPEQGARLDTGRAPPHLPAGGGACEAALNIYLENFAITLGSREQLAIAEFADALLVIPKTLAVNAAKDATELVAKLRAYHFTAQTKPDKKHLAQVGRPPLAAARTCAHAHSRSSGAQSPGAHPPPLPAAAAAAQVGLDLVNGTTRNNVEAGVLEPALSKLKIVQFATEAAITILRIDDLIRLAPEEQEGEE